MNESQRNYLLMQSGAKRIVGKRNDRPVFNSDNDEFDESTLLGPYPEAGKEIRRILGVGTARELSSRFASYKCCINHVTIKNMMHGDKPTYDVLIKFSQAMGANLNKLLRLYGYTEFKINPDRYANEFVPDGYELVPAGADTLSKQLMDKVEWVARQFDPELQPEVRQRLVEDALKDLDLRGMRLLIDKGKK